jgi:SM-20-related protein
MIQISNEVYCEEFLLALDIKTKILTNPYYDYPFLIIKNFLTDSICDEILALTKKSEDVVVATVKKHNDISKQAGLNTKIRKTKIHKLSSSHQKIYDEVFLMQQQRIEKYFNLALLSSTKVQVLEYIKGSFYKQHCDDSSVLIKDEKIIGFKPVAHQRKLSSILYTNNHSDTVCDNTFSGGELVFNYLYDKEGANIKIKPIKGDMLIFLSNPYFTHEVLTINDGFRVSLAQWHDAIV